MVEGVCRWSNIWNIPGLVVVFRDGTRSCYVQKEIDTILAYIFGEEWPWTRSLS
jgi:hypothetical protein